VARLRYSATARSDLADIYRYIRGQSGSGAVALRFTQRLRRKCEELAAAPIVMGRSRPELRSHSYEAYVIFFATSVTCSRSSMSSRDTAMWWRFFATAIADLPPLSLSERK
jgi:plasmid stabilization system protein ParE